MMTRRIVAALLSASLALSLASCSKTKEDRPVDAGATTTTAAGTTTSDKATSTTEESEEDETTTSSTGSSRTKSRGLMERLSGAASESNVEITPNEEKCVSDSAEQLGSTNPDIILDDAKLAGAIGAIIVKCLGVAKTADVLLAELKDSTEGADLTRSELNCLRNELVNAEEQDLAVFVGSIIYAGSSGDTSVLNQFEEALNDSCGTNLRS